MSIRVLCIGDPHFTEDSVREMDLFIDKTLKLIDKLLSEPEGLSLVVNLGDTLDRHEKAHLVPMTQAMKFLHEISLKVPLVIIIGNHDRVNNSVFLTDESPFWACHWWPNTTVVDTTKSLEINKYKFTFVPYVYPGRFQEALNKVEGWKDSSCIFAHQEIRGCSLGIIKSVNGDLWPEDLPLLVSGHIHEYETIGNNIIYVGTPRMKTFGDNRKKTISLFTFHHDSEWEQKRIDLELPKKTTLHVTIGQLIQTTSFLSIHDDLVGILKIFVEGTSSELGVGMKHPVIKHLKSIGVKIIPKVLDTHSEIIREKPGIKHEMNKSDIQSSIWKKLELKIDLLNLFKDLFTKREVQLRIQR